MSKLPNATTSREDLGSTLALVGLILDMACWAVSPTFFLRVATWAVGTSVLLYLTYRFPFVRKLRRSVKLLIVFLIILASISVGFFQLRPQGGQRQGISPVAVAAPAATVKPTDQATQAVKQSITISVPKKSKSIATGLVQQTAIDSTCSNVVAGGDVKIDCSPEKNNEQDKKASDPH